MVRFLDGYRGMGRIQKSFFWLAFVVLFYTLFGFFAAPAIVKAVLVKKLPEALHREVAIEKIRINPYVLSASVEGFRLDEKDGQGEFIAFERLDVNLAGASLFKRALMIQSVSLREPAINFSRLDDQTFSFSDLLADQTTDEPQPETESKPFLFSINNIEIDGGAIRYQDIPRRVDHVVADLTLAIPSISNLPSDIEVFVEPAFSAVIDGTPFSIDGETKPFADSLATEIDLHINGINIPHYLAYIPNPTGLTIASAWLDVDTQLNYIAQPTTRLALTGTVTLRELEVVDGEGNSYLRLPQLRVLLADSDLLAKEVRLSELVIDAPQVDLVRLQDEQILPFALLASAEAGSPPGAGEVDTDEHPAAEPLKLTIERLRLNDGELIFKDQALETPATVAISQLAVAVDALSTVPDSVAEVSWSLTLNRAGQLSGKGTFVLDPLQVKNELDIKNLELADFQPYISEYSHVLVDRGAYSLQGELSFDAGEAEFPDLLFAGQTAIQGLRTRDSQSGDALIQWSELLVNRIRVAYHPLELSVAEISLHDLDAQVLIREGGTLNLATLARTAAEQDASGERPAEEPGEAAPPANISLEKFSLHNGKVVFQDRSIQPAYAADFDRLSGSVTGLSSQPGSRASVEFDGRLDQAPVTLSGATNLLSDELFVDLEVDFKNFNLSPLSPYSGKYIGNRIDRGMLHLDLHYQIRGTQLESTNRVLLDQFTLGERVESPDATSLPVGLAIALLKNRRGEITLDIPVRGELDDPEFRLGGVIVQVLVNLLTRAATSPFSLLAALIPEGKDIQFIPFAAGSAEVTQEGAESLEVLAEVLYDRPGLRLDIAGRADAEHDRRAIAEQSLMRLVKLEKLRKARALREDEDQYKDVELSEEEYSEYLPAAYARFIEAVPKEEQTVAAELEAADADQELSLMEDFLLKHIKVEDQDLRLLALERANTVRGSLVASEKVEPERLFIIEPRLAAAGRDDEKQTLVELQIR